MRVCSVSFTKAVSRLLVLAAVLFLGACERPDPRLQSMIGLEPEPPTEDRVAELEDLVEEYGEVIARKIDAGIRQADTLKLLAQEYMRQQLYGPALETLEEAIRIQPENHILFYLAGASSAVIGKSQADLALRERYLRLAERSYLRAVELEPGYTEAHYALGILYSFELAEPLNAVNSLQRVLDRNSSHVAALFVLARSYVALGQIDDAVDTYDRIMDVSPDREERDRAERNRELLLGGGR